jgi:hypothetical protein
VVECVDASFVCLIINCNPIEKTLNTFPQVQELPKLSGKFVEANKRECNARNQILQAQLRLAHLKEGEQEIRRICAEYVDVFKLPGDKLTATSVIEHYIPTTTIQSTGQLLCEIIECRNTTKQRWAPKHNKC